MQVSIVASSKAARRPGINPPEKGPVHGELLIKRRPVWCVEKAMTVCLPGELP